MEVDKVCGHIFFFPPKISPHVKESKTVLDSGFQGTGFRIFCQWQLDSGFLELYSGFLSRGIPIPQAKIFRTPESGFSYMGRNS